MADPQAVNPMGNQLNGSWGQALSMAAVIWIGILLLSHIFGSKK